MERLHDKLNLETARLPWAELARHFAAGRVIRVSSRLDLLDAAAAVAGDDTARVRDWTAEGLMAPVADVEARAWHEAGAVLWAVVVKPFVLVQLPADDL